MGTLKLNSVDHVTSSSTWLWRMFGELRKKMGPKLFQRIRNKTPFAKICKFTLIGIVSNTFVTSEQDMINNLWSKNNFCTTAEENLSLSREFKRLDNGSIRMLKFDHTLALTIPLSLSFSLYHSLSTTRTHTPMLTHRELSLTLARTLPPITKFKT